jgi:hypothetical protein
VNYARRQQYRRFSHAGKAALGSVIAALSGLVIASAGAVALAGLLLLAALGLGLYAQHWLSLAGRSRVGAHAEDEVQRALATLHAEGWRLRHSLPWQGQGDIDSVAIAPTGIAVAIETKTRTYDGRHLGCGTRRGGCRGAGEDGHETVPSQSCASFVCGASSGSSTTCSWSRSTG